MSKTNHAHLSGADRFERSARRRNRRQPQSRLSTRRQVIAAAAAESW